MNMKFRAAPDPSSPHTSTATTPAFGFGLKKGFNSVYQRHQKGRLGEHTTAPPAVCFLQGGWPKASPPISICTSQSLWACIQGFWFVPLGRQEAYLSVWMQGQTQGNFTETKSLRLKNTFPLLCWCSSTPISMEISTPFLDSIHAKTAPPNPKLKLLTHIFTHELFPTSMFWQYT